MLKKRNIVFYQYGNAVLLLLIGVGIVLLIIFSIKHPSLPKTIQQSTPQQKTSTVEKSTSITQEAAAKNVRNLPEVVLYLKDVPDGKIMFDHEEANTNSFVIHVYEVKNGHTATFNWYIVNKQTGKIEKMF